MAKFLQDGEYNTWQPEEAFHGRIQDLDAIDQAIVDTEATVALKDTKKAKIMGKRRRQLKTFLNQVAKVVSDNHYNFIMWQATSLDWVYEEIRKDYNIQQKGVHFFNIIDLEYNSSVMTPVGFYQKYRQLVMANTAESGDTIKWNREMLMTDKKLSPTFEDMILLNVLCLLDLRLPKHIKLHYALKMDNSRLMDFKTDIFTNIGRSIEQIEGLEQLNALRVEPPSLAAFNNFNKNRSAAGSQKKDFRKEKKNQTLFCKLCWDTDKGKSIFQSHKEGDRRCPSKPALSVITNDYNFEEEEQDEELTADEQEVNSVQQQNLWPHCVIPVLDFLQPVPTH